MDVFDLQKRSQIMGKIGGKDTKPEIAVRSLLHRAGYRFRLHKSNLPGKPDIVLPKYKSVVFVHGCYWHRHNKCDRGRSVPSTNIEFWQEKFIKNKNRDRKSKKELQALGWKVIIVWQCELRSPKKVLSKIVNALCLTKD